VNQLLGEPLLAVFVAAAQSIENMRGIWQNDG
jgi:hypothetical protein